MSTRHRYWVYILASKLNGTLYPGVTNDLSWRSWEHREGDRKGLTERYGISRLVWCEEHKYVLNAIQREKNIKHWPRAWKINLIEEINPDWDDIYESMML